MLALLSPWDRHNVVALMQQPGERDLSRRRRFAIRHLAHSRCGAHVCVEVLTLVTWVRVAIIFGRIFLGSLRISRKKAAPEGRERNNADAEFATQRNDAR